ncbi:MAG: helix-turn-helix transcriptional regulator [Bdellovibrionales bacterium]
MTTNSNLVGYKEISDLTGLPLGTLYSMVHRKQIPHFKLGKRLVRFNLRIVKEWLERHSVRSAGGDQ